MATIGKINQNTQSVLETKPTSTLSSTDQKTEAVYRVFRFFFSAAFIIGGSIILASNLYIGAALLAIGILGFIYSVYKVWPKKSSSLPIIQIPPKPKKPVDLTPPVGILNGTLESSTIANNCWANSLIQYIDSSDKLKKAIKRVPETHELYFLKLLIEQYENDKKAGLPISSVKSSELRDYCNRRKNLNFINQFLARFDASQQDPTEILFYITDSLKEFDPTNTIKKTTRKELDIGQTELAEGELPYSQQEETAFDTQIQIPISCLTLQESLDHVWFNNHVTEDEDLQRLTKHSGFRGFPIKSTQIVYNKAPEELIIELKRFDNNNEKITTDFEVEQELRIRGEHIGQPDDSFYQLKSIILHMGDAAEGHYISFVLKGKKWFKCNDHEVTEASPEEMREVMKQGYIYLYERT